LANVSVNLGGATAMVAGPAGAMRAAVARAFLANGADAQAVDIGEAPAALDQLVAEGRTLSLLALVTLGERDFDALRVEALCRSAAALMTRGGRIVILTSALGLIAARGEVAESVRAAAILSLTRGLAMEFAERRILVNAVAAGAVADTAAPDDITARMLTHMPAGRPASADDVAAIALFLADPENSYMTGHVIAADGGWTAGFARDF
jgi:hypothetical protein